MRQVDPTEFRTAPDFDGITKLKKVYPIDYFEGIFRDNDGNTYDLRPRESMPSLTNFQRKSMGEWPQVWHIHTMPGRLPNV